MCVEKQWKLNNMLSAALSRNVRYLSDTHDLLLAAKGGKYVALSRHARDVIEIVGATRGGIGRLV